MRMMVLRASSQRAWVAPAGALPGATLAVPLGYALRRGGRVRDAVPIFALNVNGNAAAILQQTDPR